MDLRHIESSARKIIHSRKSDLDRTKPITLDGNQVSNILERGEPFRLLGVWLSTHCNLEAQFQQMKMTSHQMLG